MSGVLGAEAQAILFVLALFWILVAIAVSVIAAKRIRSAAAASREAHTLQVLLASGPAQPLLIRRGLSIEAGSGLLRELGLSQPPEDIEALAGDGKGLAREDLEQLAADVRSATQTGCEIKRSVRLAGSDRVMEVRGGPAPPALGLGGILLWFSDASAAEGQKADLTGRLSTTEHRLESLAQLIESAPFPMWYRGPDLALALVNQAYVNAVEGRDSADVIARGSELIDQPGDEGAKASAKAALEAGQAISRHRPATIGGERRMLRIVDVPLSTGAVAGFAIDIQDLEDARYELSQYIQSQRELSDRMSAGAAVFDVDHHLSFFNQPFALMARLDPEWLAEKPEFDRLFDRMRDQHRLPEVRDFPAWMTERRGWFTSTEELIQEDWILANGDHLRVVAQPLPDGGLRLIIEDRTEQVRLASARDTLLRVRSATFDNLFEAVSVFAADGRLYLWNERFCSVWELDENWLAEHPRVDELVPAMARRLVNPATAAKVRELVRSATNDRRQGTGRVSMTDGRHFEFAVVPLPDGNALLTMVDVTDSTRIEAALRERATALEEADRVKTDFVAHMSYELRTPLTSIGGFAEMLEGGYAGDLGPAAKDYVAAILESVARLSKMIDEVLDLTQGDTKGVILERERIDVAGLCRAVASSLSGRIDDNGQKLELVIDPSCGTVIGDARRLRDAIEHVLRNAVAYTERGGLIELRATGDEDSAVIAIQDNGPGIDPADQSHVFMRFHRVGGQGGSDAALGLGLPLTRQFIEAHGGTVELSSVRGKGTTVTMTIPRKAD